MASSFAAQNAMETAQMLHDIESFQLGDDDDGEKKKEWYQAYDQLTLLTMGLGMASIVVNVLAMILWQSGAVIVAGAIALFLAPLIVYRQIQMQNKDGMRLLQNKLRHNANVFATQNTRLRDHIDTFQTQLEGLQDCERQLAQITQDQQYNVNELVELVKENGQINTAIVEAIKARAIQDVVNTFLDSDRDESSQLDEREIQMLLFRLSKLEGVVIRQELFWQKMNQDSSMAAILAMLQTSMKKDDDQLVQLQPQDRVFHFEGFSKP